jgi:hypothetical protein
MTGAPARPDFVRKLEYLLKLSQDLALSNQYQTIAITASQFPAAFDTFVGRYLRRRASVAKPPAFEETAKKWLAGAVRQPQKRQREYLAEFFTRLFAEYIRIKEIRTKFSPDWFREDVSFQIFNRYFPDERELFSIQFRLAQRIFDTFIDANRDEIAQIFSGWKILFRYAIENSGRISREAMRISWHGNELRYQLWFKAIGASGIETKRVNEGVVIPLQDVYWATGIHDGPLGGQVRFRSIAVQKKPFHPVTHKVQSGLVMAGHPTQGYPVATRLIWVTVDDSAIADQDAFPDRVIDFFDDFPTIEKDLQARTAIPNSAAVVGILERMMNNKQILATSGRHLLSIESSELTECDLRVLCAVHWGRWFSD